MLPLASPGSLTENFAERKEKSVASQLDRKRLWRVIYIIKEDKSLKFTRLGALSSGDVNGASHLQLLRDYSNGPLMNRSEVATELT